MKTMKAIRPNSLQSNLQLWLSLPERQQEQICGGAPKVNGSSNPRL